MAKNFKPPKGRMKKAPKLQVEDEASVVDWISENIWNKIKHAIGQVPFTTHLVGAYFCAIDTKTAATLESRLLLYGAIIYFISPIDAVPDFLLFFGYTDDVSVLSTVLLNFKTYISDRHYKAANKQLKSLGLKD